MTRANGKFDPRLDLVLERTVDVPPELVWAAWTRPEQVKKWFTPAPWQTVDCEIDLRPGGIFRFVMRSPEGEDFPLCRLLPRNRPQQEAGLDHGPFAGIQARQFGGRGARVHRDNCA